MELQAALAVHRLVVIVRGTDAPRTPRPPSATRECAPFRRCIRAWWSPSARATPSRWGVWLCRNSESADARIVLERWWGRWRPEASWILDATAHAEAGER